LIIEDQYKQAKPISFNTQMVEAILDNRKSVTRRVVKPKYKDDESGFQVVTKTDGEFVRVEKVDENGSSIFNDLTVRYVNQPYKVGEVYYVRETWRIGYLNDDTKEMTIIFKAIQSGCDIETKKCKFSDERYDKFRKFAKKKGWQSPYFMPKEAARIFIEMTKIWVEKLQEIDDEGAKAEGANFVNGYNVGWEEKMNRSVIQRYEDIWNNTIPKKDISIYGWNANPHVWANEFKRLQ
jgi:hypothetical protein